MSLFILENYIRRAFYTHIRMFWFFIFVALLAFPCFIIFAVLRTPHLYLQEIRALREEVYASRQKIDRTYSGCTNKYDLSLLLPKKRCFRERCPCCGWVNPKWFLDWSPWRDIFFASINHVSTIAPTNTRATPATTATAPHDLSGSSTARSGLAPILRSSAFTASRSNASASTEIITSDCCSRRPPVGSIATHTRLVPSAALTAATYVSGLAATLTVKLTCSRG